MIVVKLLRGVLKIRYLVLGGAIGGGLTLQQVCYVMLLALLCYDEHTENFYSHRHITNG